MAVLANIEVGFAPDPPQRWLLVSEYGTSWPALADGWRRQGAEVSVLIQDDGEGELEFVRRLYALVARAEREQRPFAAAALMVRTETSARLEPRRMRLSSALADVLVRAQRPAVLYVGGGPSSEAPRRCGLERLHGALARELEGSLLTLRIGEPPALLPPMPEVLAAG